MSPQLSRRHCSLRSPPINISTTTTLPHRQVVNQYRRLAQNARCTRPSAQSAATAVTNGPIRPTGSGACLNTRTHMHGQRAASMAASQRRPGQYGASGRGSRASNSHMLLQSTTHGSTNPSIPLDGDYRAGTWSDRVHGFAIADTGILLHCLNTAKHRTPGHGH
jgi:hypothetical protein